MTSPAEHEGMTATSTGNAHALPAKAMLSTQGVLRVSGDDARQFLHGQFTADMKRLQSGRGRLAAWCSPKGRVLFLMHVLCVDDAFLLLLPASELPALHKRLKLYVLRAKVLVEDLSPGWSVMGLANDDTLPAEAGLLEQSDDGAVGYRLPGTPALGYVLGPQAAVRTRWDRSSAPALAAPGWEALEIAAALPSIEGPLAERFLPQELGLEQLDGLHFDKGCYPGQEVIARLKYRGQVKSGLHRGVTHENLAPGDRLYGAGASAAVGEVLRVASLADGKRVLAVVHFDAVGAPLHLRACDGPPIAFDT
jgi:folate-binding protein YgfZ